MKPKIHPEIIGKFIIQILNLHNIFPDRTGMIDDESYLIQLLNDPIACINVFAIDNIVAIITTDIIDNVYMVGLTDLPYIISLLEKSKI